MPPRESWDERIRTVTTQGMQPLVETILGRWFTPEFRAAEPDRVDRVRQMLLSTDPLGYAACCAAIRDMDQRTTIRTITAKTLVIGGSKDPATPPAEAELIASSIPDAKLVMLEAAHLSNIERADGVHDRAAGISRRVVLVPDSRLRLPDSRFPIPDLPSSPIL